MKNELHITLNCVGVSMNHMVMYNVRQIIINHCKFVSNNKKLRKGRIHISHLNNKKNGVLWLVVKIQKLHIKIDMPTSTKVSRKFSAIIIQQKIIVDHTVLKVDKRSFQMKFRIKKDSKSQAYYNKKQRQKLE